MQIYYMNACPVEYQKSKIKYIKNILVFCFKFVSFKLNVKNLQPAISNFKALNAMLVRLIN